MRRAGEAELGDRVAGIRLLELRDGVHDRRDLLLGLRLLAGDVELHERRVAVLGDLAMRPGRDRRAHVFDVLQPFEPRDRSLDRPAECRIGHLGGLRLDEDALGGGLREAGVAQDLLRSRGLAGGLLCVGELDGADGGPDDDRGDDECEPPEGGGLPMGRTPLRGACGKGLSRH